MWVNWCPRDCVEGVSTWVCTICLYSSRNLNSFLLCKFHMGKKNLKIVFELVVKVQILGCLRRCMLQLLRYNRFYFKRSLAQTNKKSCRTVSHLLCTFCNDINKDRIPLARDGIKGGEGGWDNKGYRYLYTVFRIRIQLDPDPAKILNPDPEDP